MTTQDANADNEQVEIAMDFNGMELSMLSALAHIGAAVLSNDEAAAMRLVQLVDRLPDSEKHASSALRKVESAVSLGVSEAKAFYRRKRA